MPRPRARAVVLVVVLTLLVGGCGEPAVDLEIPPRAQGQQVLDEVGLLDGSGVDERLAELRDDGVDVVALAFESPEASLGHADRSGRALVDAWGADAVLVAVAEEGDFTSTAEDRRRFFGIMPADTRALSRGTRERVAEELAPPLAADNDWVGVFEMAIDEVAPELGGGS